MQITDIYEANRIIKILTQDVRDQFHGKLFWAAAFIIVLIYAVFREVQAWT